MHKKISDTERLCFYTGYFLFLLYKLSYKLIIATRSSPEKSLSEIWFKLLDLCPFFLVFNTFNTNLQAKIMDHPAELFQQIILFFICHSTRCKRTVNFDDLRIKFTEIMEIRIAGSKIIPDAFTDLKDMDINWDDFGKLKQSYSMVDDTHYGVPFDNGAVIACYRTDILDEAGYTLDDLTDITWSKFMEIGKDVHEKTGKYLLTSEATGGDTLMMMMQSCGANFVNEDGEAYIVGNDTAEKCINLYVDLVKNDVVKLVNNWDEYIATITSGEAAGIVNGNWITATLMSTEDQKGLWEITTMPKVDDVDTATNYANNGGSSWYITSNCKNVELAEDFLASTFGSSTDFYDAILPASGAISCYLPAGESEVYNEPNEFFGGQPIFSTIVEYSSHIPEFTKTPYHYESRECVNTAVINIVNGTSVEDALQEAQDTLAFKMTE